MFNLGDCVRITRTCSVPRWVGVTGTVIDPAFGRSGELTRISLDTFFRDDTLGIITTLELYHDRYELLNKEPDWEV